MSKYIVLLLSVVMSCVMFGCGGGGSGDTSGTLTLADITTKDLTGGRYEISSSAIFAPANSKSPVGSEIKFTAVYTTKSGASDTRSSTVTLSTTGIAAFSALVDQGDEPVYVTLTASIGGLSQTRNSSVPAIAPLTLAPAAVSFSNVEGIGVSKTITVSGGFSPYSVSSSKTDIQASNAFGSSVVTLIKNVNVSATPIADSAIITVTDNKGNQITANVGYYR